MACLIRMQIFGPESSGKTTVALHAMAEVQKAGGTVALIDAEHAFDPSFAKVRSGSYSCQVRAAMVTGNVGSTVGQVKCSALLFVLAALHTVMATQRSAK